MRGGCDRRAHRIRPDRGEILSTDLDEQRIQRFVDEPGRRRSAFHSVLEMGETQDRAIDDPRRPVWLEATDSFYKSLNRIAKRYELSRYEAIVVAPTLLRREAEVRNSALNRNIKSPAQSEVFRRTIGQVSQNCRATISAEEKREPTRKSAQARLDRY
jgi:hypothetical protein